MGASRDGHFFNPAVQLRTTVMGAEVSLLRGCVDKEALAVGGHGVLTYQ